MKAVQYFLLAVAITLACYKTGAQPKEEVFTGWEDYKTDIPQWFKDAKFGIYFHWGVYTVPAYNSEWYSRTMYVPNTTPYKHHLATYGSLKTFGYKDFIPMFTAPRFNADEWVELFEKAGAKFAGPVAEHADGFSMWASKVNPWNANDMGPQRDIVGELAKAVRAHRMKLITTFHHQWQWGWYPTMDTSVDAGNPAYEKLYGLRVSDSAWMHKPGAEKPNDSFSKYWLAKVEEVVKSYDPDILYFDSRLNHLPQQYRKEMLDVFFANKKDKKSKVLLYKGKELPDSIGVRTYEKLRLNKIGDKPWLTEEPISTYSWSYTDDIKLRSASSLLHGLIDIVSKNGVFLLNICPKADGTIPADQQQILLSIGGWLKEFGEAIYGTRAWYTYGEGPRKIAEQTEVQNRAKYFETTYSAKDTRYTTRGKNIYAIFLGQPDAGANILLTAFNKDSLPPNIYIKNITVMGRNSKVEWQLLPTGLSVRIPADLPNKMATVFIIQTKTISNRGNDN